MEDKFKEILTKSLNEFGEARHVQAKADALLVVRECLASMKMYADYLETMEQVKHLRK